MRKSFVNVQTPMLAGVVKEKTPEMAISEILNYYHPDILLINQAS